MRAKDVRIWTRHFAKRLQGTLKRKRDWNFLISSHSPLIWQVVYFFIISVTSHLTWCRFKISECSLKSERRDRWNQHVAKFLSPHPSVANREGCCEVHPIVPTRPASSHSALAIVPQPRKKPSFNRSMGQGVFKAKGGGQQQESVEIFSYTKNQSPGWVMHLPHHLPWKCILNCLKRKQKQASKKMINQHLPSSYFCQHECLKNQKRSIM